MSGTKLPFVFIIVTDCRRPTESTINASKSTVSLAVLTEDSGLEQYYGSYWISRRKRLREIENT